MGLPRWKRTGGRDFVFYHSHPGFEWDDLAMTTAYQDMLCVDFQWATVLAVEQGQRWRCPSYSPRCRPSHAIVILMPLMISTNQGSHASL